MAETRVELRVRELLLEIYELSGDEVEETDDVLLDELGDSLQHLEFLAAVEREFGFNVTDEEAESIRSLGQLLSTVARRAVLP